MKHLLLLLALLIPAGCDDPQPPHAGIPDTPPSTTPTYKVRFETSRGDFVIGVHRDWAPRGADRFKELVEAGFFDECRFFRVMRGFMAQFGISGDPAINAQWRSKVIEDDPVRVPNERGTICFATSGKHSRTTQVFISFGDNRRLDQDGFSPFGKVIEGMDTVDALYDGYGEGAPKGGGPHQGRIQEEGNAYLKRDFDRLDYVKRARIVP